MMHEVLSQIQTDIQTALSKKEFQFKSVRIAHYREASYFAFGGNFVYVIVDYPISGTPTFCFVGATNHLSRTLTQHRNNHRFTHAFVVDMFDSTQLEREMARDLLIEKLDPIFQGEYYPVQKYRTNNFERPFSSREIVQWNDCRRRVR